ncbi:hypothetical protein [Virgibacillus halodenitrificans]|uniref:hypothetical protein n=1 Tax=Virgibacillus halodenitrificans TaxID=1482 RepID=UPI00045D3BEC|nr:hypothetical protein [Virgibacillus halodenitrificans]CDQ37119.1 hypothetical protein BN993_06652 [Virgibacillus halodenitrificans]
MKVKKILLDILGFVSFSGPYPDVSEEDISNNIQLLKKNQWFQTLMNDEKYREFVVHDKDVRYEIGYLNTKKLKRNVHKDRYKKKIQKILDKRNNQLSNILT